MASFKIELDADDTALDRAVDRQMDKLDRLADKAGTVDLGGRSRSSGGTGGRGGLAPDPWARHDDAMTDMHAVSSIGGLSSEQMRPYELAAAKAGRGAARADAILNGETPGGMWGRMGFGASGFNLRSGMSSLISPEMLGVAGLAVGAYELHQAGVQSRREMQSAYWTGGGSEAETGAVTSVGRFLGRSPGESAAAAVGFGESLHGGTYGAGWMRARGIVDLGGLTIDKDANYLRGVRAIWDEPSRDIATRVARDLDLVPELNGRDLSPSDRKEMLDRRADDMSPETRQSQSRYDNRKGEIESWWARQVRGVSDFFDTGVDDERHAAEDAKRPGKAWWESAYEYDRDWYGHRAQAIKEGKLKPDGIDKAAAMNNVRITPGVVGSQRVQSSMPPAAKGMQLDQNLRGYGQYCGGYFIG